MLNEGERMCLYDVSPLWLDVLCFEKRKLHVWMLVHLLISSC